jgi:uncharacterized protein
MDIAMSPLIMAAHAGHIAIVRELVDHGATVDFVGQDGATALYTAAVKGRTAIVRELVHLGAKVDIIINGRTPLYAAARKGRTETVRELIHLGATVDFVSEDGDTPLSCSSKWTCSYCEGAD